MQYENIEYEKRGAKAYVTLNRPDKLNALSPDLQLEVRHALEDAGWEDDDIRVIVLKAAGRAFSALASTSRRPRVRTLSSDGRNFLKVSLSALLAGGTFFGIILNRSSRRSRASASPADWPLQPSAISGFVPKMPSSAHRKYAREAPTSRLSGHGSSA